jgi:hypothetical protein
LLHFFKGEYHTVLGFVWQLDPPPTSNSFFPNVDLSVSFWDVRVFLIFEEIGAEQANDRGTAPCIRARNQIKSHRFQKKQIKPHNSNQIAMSSSSASSSSNNAAPELFKETFASEFGKLVAAGVDKPAAAAQALLAAQRAFQQQQQQQEAVAPAAPVDDDMQRKGKVAASVSTTAVNFPSAKTMQQVPRCPSHHRCINPQIPHFFRRWRPTDRSGRLSASGACGRFCGSASRSTRTDTSSTSWAAPSGCVVAACEHAR